MLPRPALSLAQSLAAAQDWWREAGVDCAFDDEPQAWLADKAPAGEQAPAPLMRAAPVAPARPEPPRIGGDRAGWPTDLAAFSRWWLDEPSLDEGGMSPRVPPRIEPSADLLILVPMPEEADRDTLLSGAQGRMLASFAHAAGIPPGSTAFAAALPRHTPMPDWDGLAARGHGEVLQHLLGLASPKRLIVLGRGILPLLGHGPTQGTPAVSELAIQGRSIPLLATYAPERLLEHARPRASLWRWWLEWTDGTSE